VRPPQPPPPPPLVVRQRAPALPQPPPLILRERPPVAPAVTAGQTGVNEININMELIRIVASFYVVFYFK
jgi:hypothetical protein